MGTAIALLIAGVILGALIGYFIRQPTKEAKQREDQLNEQIKHKEDELAQYKQQVADHFLHTANLVNSMTESYRAVHEHLADGARTLCSDLVGVQQLEIKQTRLLDKEAAEEATPIAETEKTSEEAVTEEKAAARAEKEPESVVAKEDVKPDKAAESSDEEASVVRAAGSATADTSTEEERKRTIH